jgi:hypothetical protein
MCRTTRNRQRSGSGLLSLLLILLTVLSLVLISAPHAATAAASPPASAPLAALAHPVELRMIRTVPDDQPDLRASLPITDDISLQATPVVSPLSVSVTEGGAPATYTIVLPVAPLNDVVVAIATDAQTSVSPGSLTFTPGNWDVPQTVTVTAVDDVISEGDHNSVVLHTVTSADPEYDGVATPGVSVAIADNDTPGVALEPTSLTTSEGAASTSYTVTLEAAPLANVTISVASDGQSTVNPSELLFTPANWDRPQSVTVTARDDAVAEGDHTSTINHSAASLDANYNGLPIDTVAVAIADNDTAGIVLANTADLTTSEAGDTASFTARLQSQPTADVRLVLSSDQDEGRVSPAELLFTAATWDTAQTVTIRGVDDAIDDGDTSYAIEVLVTSADSTYNTLRVPDIAVTNTDDDTAAVRLSRATMALDEGAAPANYTIVLESQPRADVTIAIRGDEQVVITPTEATFTEATWDTPQTITVQAVDDDAFEEEHSSTISHVARSADATYASMNIDALTVRISDNDAPPTGTAGPVVFLPYISAGQPPVVAEGQPDLIGSFRLSPNRRSFTAGEPVQVTAVITNIGTAATDRTFWVDLFINPDEPPDPSQLPLTWNQTCNLDPCFGIAWGVTQILAPGESITLVSTPDQYFLEQTVWPGWFASGSSDLYLYVDTWHTTGQPGTQDELDETNNRTDLHGLQVTGENPPVLLPQSHSSLPPRTPIPARSERAGE